MTAVSLPDAQANLAEIIDRMAPGDEVVITRGNREVARLVVPPTERPRPIPGRCQGQLTIVSDDDEHLKDWAEYLP